MRELQPFDRVIQQEATQIVHKGNLFNMARKDKVRVIGKMTPEMVKRHYNCIRLKDPV